MRGITFWQGAFERDEVHAVPAPPANSGGGRADDWSNAVGKIEIRETAAADRSRGV